MITVTEAIKKIQALRDESVNTRDNCQSLQIRENYNGFVAALNTVLEILKDVKFK